MKTSQSQPLVSIGMPTYNRSGFLPGTINALLNQTYHNFELIISDNASTDNTAEVCKKLAKKDKRIRYIRQKTNIGAVRNFNYVLDQAKGKYYFWAADDDFWDKNFIEKIIKKMLEDNETVLGVCGYHLFTRKQKVKIIPKPELTNSRFRSLLFYLNNSYEISIFFYGIFQTAMLKKIKGLHTDRRPFYNQSSDILTVFKVLLYGKIEYVPLPLFSKRDTGYFLTVFNKLQKGQSIENLQYRIIRYCSYYLYNYIDLYFLIKFTLQSSLTATEKLKVSILCLRNFFQANLLFIKNIFTGGFKIFSRLSPFNRSTPT